MRRGKVNKKLQILESLIDDKCSIDKELNERDVPQNKEGQNNPAHAPPSLFREDYDTEKQANITKNLLLIKAN